MTISERISNKGYEIYQDMLEKEVLEGPIPSHIAIIMDGNRRYAKEHGKDVREGHLEGKERIRDVLNWCMKAGVRTLTVYAFSTENFNREEGEVEFLLNLIESSLKELSEDPQVIQNRVRLKVIGERDLIPPDMMETILAVEEKTKDFEKYQFNMAIAYGGRQEIVGAVKEIAERVKAGELDIESIDEDLISKYMYTSDISDPELILRTSGELRLSNFLLWQLAYSELYFTDVYWPSFRYIDFLRAIRSYQQRSRRFGK
ncbi:MAG: di-trans,poly-cis-decaprenylcistransferase [Candidatus Methanomethylophilaceae archaeon]|nr:di-trans,poly-cis-decaprenylcistransferase [Candidatus Methanomethylophilaceae archaeon]